ncbi:MAG: hypothetical protein HYZ42_03645 [Bacteroidetes bacterium]|nr:hypothetical protein [Bacteroidota bacterium]
MKQTIKISIQEPCHEDWNGMTPNKAGRHCDSCNKTVVDFKLMSDSEIFNYFKTHQNICGNFYPFQLEKSYTEPVELKKTPTYKKWLVAALNSQVLTGDTIYSPIDTVDQKKIDSSKVAKPDSLFKDHGQIINPEIYHLSGTSISTLGFCTQSVGNVNIVSNPPQIFPVPFDTINENPLPKAKADSIIEVLKKKKKWNNQEYGFDKEQEDEEYRETSIFYMYAVLISFMFVAFFINLFNRIKNMKN